MDQNDLYGKVTQELLLEKDSESGELNTEELNQDGLNLEESAKEGKATKAFGAFESQGAREASYDGKAALTLDPKRVENRVHL